MKFIDLFYIVFITVIILAGGYAVSEVAIAGSWQSFVSQNLPEQPREPCQ